MEYYQISNKNAKILSRIVNSGDFKNPEAVLSHLIKEYASELIQPQGIVIDLQPAKDGARKTQESWVVLYNAQEGEFKGKRMISAPDIYQAGKTGSTELLESLRNDFIEDWIVSGTSPLFNENDLSAKIIQNYGSTVVKPTEINVAEVPIYQGESVIQVVEGKGLPYTRALFGTKDKPNKIIDTLQRLCQKAPENIEFWTPDQGSRKSYPKRAVWFGGSGDEFLVLGNLRFVINCGRSRGVLINPRSGRSKK